MMDFIMVPLIIGIVTLGIYKLFELFVRKKERLTIIERIDNFNAESIKSNLSFFDKEATSIKKFGSLKVGSLIFGVGLGLLIGFFINNYYFGAFNVGNNDHYNINQIQEVVYGASTMIFGGLGLLISFIIEIKLSKKN